MPEAENFIAVDWRSGKDKCYFFFKDSNTYSRYDNNDDLVPEDYPKPINSSSWGDFHQHAKNLRFGFATSRHITANRVELDPDILWLFYYEGDTPMFCEYDQDVDSIRGLHTVAGSIWAPLLPYFDRIVAGTWWKKPHKFNLSNKYRFLLNDGNGLDLNWNTREVTLHTINDDSWPGLKPYKYRITTAVQMNADFGDSYYFIFLTGKQYLKYNIDKNELAVGPRACNNKNWPGLFME
ncbi:T9SS C-terminal target domain-containing protein [Pseudomonas sp. IT-P253]|jgi:hypothetical protein|uniref:hypothetical protein n=1 Tax=Pseudomonas sp. IT-P253 TaxID=3026455 RepID=UPI0039DFE6F3